MCAIDTWGVGLVLTVWDRTKPTSLGSRFAKALAEKGGEVPKTEAKEGALFGK